MPCAVSVVAGGNCQLYVDRGGAPRIRGDAGRPGGDQCPGLWPGWDSPGYRYSVPLLERPDHEIEAVIAEWVESGAKCFTELEALLLRDQPPDDAEAMEKAGAEAMAWIERTIPKLEVSTTNLKRLMRWCGVSTLPAAYGALLSRFARKLPRPELAHVYREALDLFGEEQTAALAGEEGLRHLEWRGIRQPSCR